MNSPFLHFMWSDRKSRLGLTPACELFSFSQGWAFAPARPVWTSGAVLDPHGLICEPMFGPWLICGFLWTIGEFWVRSLLDRIGMLGHFVIGFSVGIVCVIAML